MPQEPYFHDESATVRFWVVINGTAVGATIGKTALHYHFMPGRSDDQPLPTYLAHAADMEAAVRRRVAAGSIEPVMLREADLRQPAGA